MDKSQKGRGDMVHPVCNTKAEEGGVLDKAAPNFTPPQRDADREQAVGRWTRLHNYSAGHLTLRFAT